MDAELMQSVQPLAPMSKSDAERPTVITHDELCAKPREVKPFFLSWRTRKPYAPMQDDESSDPVDDSSRHATHAKA